MVKKKSVEGCVEEEPAEVVEESKDPQSKMPPFRNPNYQHQTLIGGKKKTWRSLKQIVAHEKSLPWPPETPLYSNIGGPPALKPPKKYSDISGLEGKYIDPQTKLFYTTSDEFSTIRSLPSDITAGYLSLRGANNPIP
ncbi:Vacuolar protein sorting protein 36 Vps36 [Nesidiocoris tenuis]|uniref:Vacuolar protein sorting protein 36 Vps36 n=1 Tax=Nesidiocoris tenuis TaxID=355587 RepID=A0ABN7B7Y8_9HEMI|nr:Vacuolar protein sorting protein 36 Vps36 [Nesidiocoris tenuis]